MKKIKPTFLLVILFVSFLISCKNSSDIAILYTNDIHCTIDTDFGFPELSAYKNNLKRKMTNVLTVDAGDAIQGNAIGLASKGEAIINIMNVVGYDFATFGNHEFDYGLQNLRQLLDIANAQYLCCNIDYAGEDATFINHFSPYIIKQYGKINLAFIGALTPDTQKISIVDSNNAERNLYNFYEKDSGKALYQKIQDTVNECRSLGADYIILLAHLGTTDSVYSSYAVAANTESIDIIIDGHSHSVIEDEVVKNSLGKDVHITSTGSHFKNFGKLLISPQGKFSFSLISAGAYKKQDSSVAQCIKNEKSKTEDLLNAIVAKSNKTLDYTNSKNERIILKEETALGDFCADAFRLTSNADIALINAGGIRSGIVEGNITNKDLYSVFPFGNLLCTAHIRGDKILEALEYAYSFLPNASKTFLLIPRLRMESIIPGILIGEPLLTETSNGFSLSPNFFPVISSIFLMYSLIWP